MVGVKGSGATPNPRPRHSRQGDHTLPRRAGLRSGTHGGREAEQGHAQSTTTPLPPGRSHAPSSCRTPIRYPRWAGGGAGPRPIHDHATPAREITPSLVVPYPDPVPRVGGRRSRATPNPQPRQGDHTLTRLTGLRSGTHGGREAKRGHTHITITLLPPGRSHAPSSCRTPIRYPRWAGCGAGPRPIHDHATPAREITPSLVLPDSDPVPMVGGMRSGASPNPRPRNSLQGGHTLTRLTGPRSGTHGGRKAERGHAQTATTPLPPGRSHPHSSCQTPIRYPPWA